MRADECLVDLTKTDIYPDGGVIPDLDVEVCLKVLRTIRTAALGPKSFDANVAVVLSHAHGIVHDLVTAYKKEYGR